MGSYVSCVSEKKMVWWYYRKVSVGENVVLVKFSHIIDPSIYLHWPAIGIKCWFPVNHILQLLSIQTVNTSGCPHIFLKSEFKDTQKQFTENLWTWKHSFMHLPIEICSSTLNSLIIIGNILKHLTLIQIKVSLFLFFVQLFLFISMNLYMK